MGRTDAAFRSRQRNYARRITVNGRLVAPVPVEQHGRLHTYQHHGCRCDLCASAARGYFRNRREASG